MARRAPGGRRRSAAVSGGALPHQVLAAPAALHRGCPRGDRGRARCRCGGDRARRLLDGRRRLGARRGRSGGLDGDRAGAVALPGARRLAARRPALRRPARLARSWPARCPGRQTRALAAGLRACEGARSGRVAAGDPRRASTRSRSARRGGERCPCRAPAAGRTSSAASWRDCARRALPGRPRSGVRARPRAVSNRDRRSRAAGAVRGGGEPRIAARPAAARARHPPAAALPGQGRALALSRRERG